jgi:putative spermidine/putrescine transport system ATP-binding protein
MDSSGSPHRAGTPALTLRNLTKWFGSVCAVDDVNFEVQPGEFITLLGPSGSGKTTTLRMVAGFMAPSSGRIEVDGRDITGVPPYRRDLGMVFQNYALFPHMTAAQNVAFPLQMRRISKKDAAQRVDRALALVHLEGLGHRYPRELSGGQQQRVALARAIVFEPRMLLMDEPLGALDKKLRESLQVELKRLHADLGITVLYVTHDQNEALVLSDRIAIFHRGRIEQSGTGEELYETPASVFVADFIGESNFFRGTFDLTDAPAVVVPGGRLCASAVAPGEHIQPGDPAVLVVRPEKIEITAGGAQSDAGFDVLPGRIRELTYLGSSLRYEVDVPGQTIVATVPAGNPATVHQRGADVAVRWRAAHAVIVPDSAVEQADSMGAKTPKL